LTLQRENIELLVNSASEIMRSWAQLL